MGAFPCLWCVGPSLSDGWDTESHYDPAGSEPIHTGSISKCASFWKTFVKSKWGMNWIDYGYDLVWDQLPPTPRELWNSKSSNDNHKLGSKVVAEMLEAGAVSVLPSDILPIVVSPLGLVPKPRYDKLRMAVNMKYVNEHLAKRVFKFEDLSDLSDMAEKGDWSVAYDLTSGCYHVSLHQDSRKYVDF